MPLPQPPTHLPGPLLAIDFGSRRVGVAISDPERRLALPLVTLARTSDRRVIGALKEIAAREGVRGLVVGQPRRLDGSAGEAAARVERFAGRLARELALPCRLIDEALTSVAAEERLRQAGLDPRRHRERVDQVAAQILLEEHLAAEAPR